MVCIFKTRSSFRSMSMVTSAYVMTMPPVINMRLSGTTTSNDDHFSPRGGLLWRPDELVIRVR